MNFPCTVTVREFQGLNRKQKMNPINIVERAGGAGAGCGEERFRQLVIETSAVDFGELAASQSLHARPGSFVCLSREHTGRGIAMENLPRIFELLTNGGCRCGNRLGWPRSLASFNNIMAGSMSTANPVTEQHSAFIFRVSKKISQPEHCAAGNRAGAQRRQ